MAETPQLTEARKALESIIDKLGSIKGGDDLVDIFFRIGEATGMAQVGLISCGDAK